MNHDPDDLLARRDQSLAEQAELLAFLAERSSRLTRAVPEWVNDANEQVIASWEMIALSRELLNGDGVPRDGG